MGVIDFAASAGRLIGSVCRAAYRGAVAFGGGVSHAAGDDGKSGSLELQRVSDAVRVKKMILEHFGKLPWYSLAAFAAFSFALTIVIICIEYANMRDMAGPHAIGKAAVLGMTYAAAVAVALMAAEHFFGFILFAVGPSLPFVLRTMMSIITVVISVAIIYSNFVSLEKRDASAKIQEDQQRAIIELAKGAQKTADRVVAGAESLSRDAGATRTPNLMRGAAQAQAKAAEAAEESARLTRDVIQASKAAPVVSTESVQGPFAKLFSLIQSLTIFFTGYLASRLCGLLTLMARQEYVATRKEVNAAPNLKTSDVSKRKPLPDKIELPKIDVPDLGIDPRPAAPVVPFTPRNRLQRAAERGAVGTPPTQPKPSPGPATPPRIDSESIPGASIDSEGPGGSDGGESIPRDPEPHSVDSETGRVTWSARAGIDPGTEPLLRILLERGDIETITNRSAAELLREAGKGMAATKVAAAVNNLHEAGLLENTGGYHGGKRVTHMMRVARASMEANSPTGMQMTVRQVIAILKKGREE